ncbi:DUF4365 domain-containing protein [Pseudomonas oryzicola]|uniref:DUF4365 domain-containing protein n=1 Tax=Pseudomonas oryzicola TaxID=485876 RepID=A0ABS6Q6H9_9PSED|nr:DUF4365 domain-containing protein [Pseudomonas oryzicola]MBV4489778.1 DUF4365 domain-containing protein [Pseudomonas oryzicola]
MARYSETERIGVSAIELIAARELKWIFREQMIADMGIDAHLELVEDGHPSGKLIGLQIKTGPGNFTVKDDCLVYYGSIEHREYWLNHSLPVIIIAHLPETGETCWAHVSEENVELTPKAWKIEISRKNIFGEAKRRSLSQIFEGSESQQKLRRLAMDEPLMRHVKKGGKVSVELEDWINKSLGRTPVTVYMEHDDGSETVKEYGYVFHSRFDIEALTLELFPWSTASIDEDFYEVSWDRFGEDDYSWEDDCRPPKNKFYPYTNACNEVDYYRIKLGLNKIGESYLVISEYLARPKREKLFND